MPAYRVSNGRLNTIMFGTDKSLDPKKNNWTMIQRLPQFDGWEKHGYVPIQLLVEHHNWHGVRCLQCGTLISKSLSYDRKKKRSINPVYRGPVCYCSPECEETQGTRRSIEEDVLEEAKKLLLIAYPWATIRGSRVTRVNGINVIQVELTHPSLKMSVDWDSRYPRVINVCREDYETWESLTEGKFNQLY